MGCVYLYIYTQIAKHMNHELDLNVGNCFGILTIFHYQYISYFSLETNFKNMNFSLIQTAGSKCNIVVEGFLFLDRDLNSK